MKWINKLISKFSVKSKKKDNSIIVNGVSANGSIYINNGTVIVDGDVVNTFDNAAPVYILIQGDVNADISAKGSIIVEGHIQGKADAGTSITCENINSGAKAGTSIKCGNIEGNTSAGTSITAKDIDGNMNAGTSIKVANKK